MKRFIVLLGILGLAGELGFAEEKFFLTKEPDSDTIDWWLQIEHPGVIKEIPAKGRGWTHLTTKDGKKIAVLIGMDQLDGASLIPVSGFVFNRSFEEWRCFMSLTVEGVGMMRAEFNEKKERLEIIELETRLGKISAGEVVATFSQKAINAGEKSNDQNRKKPE